MENTAPKPFCFVLMPFNEDFDDVYQVGIKDSCKDAGMYCERVDEQSYIESTMERVYNQIAKADIIIADMTGRNPNVFYEVGYAHALGKPTILLTQIEEDIPFDLRPFPHIIYKKRITKIKAELTKKLTWLRENLGKVEKQFKSGIDLYIEKQKLVPGRVAFLLGDNFFTDNVYPDGTLFQVRVHFNISLHNSSSKLYHPEEFRIGIESLYPVDESHRSDLTKLPNDIYLSMLPYSKYKLYPEAYTTVKIRITVPTIVHINMLNELTLKMFFESGCWSYPLKINRGR